MRNTWPSPGLICLEPQQLTALAIGLGRWSGNRRHRAASIVAGGVGAHDLS